MSREVERDRGIERERFSGAQRWHTFQRKLQYNTTRRARCCACVHFDRSCAGETFVCLTLFLSIFLSLCEYVVGAEPDSPPLKTTLCHIHKSPHPHIWCVWILNVVHLWQQTKVSLSTSWQKSSIAQPFCLAILLFVMNDFPLDIHECLADRISLRMQSERAAAAAIPISLSSSTWFPVGEGQKSAFVALIT